MTQIDELCKELDDADTVGKAHTVAIRAIRLLQKARAPRTIGETFDYKRVREWALSRPRKQANLSFTSGIERDVAYLIEDLDSQPRTITREEFEAAAEASREFFPGRMYYVEDDPTAIKWATNLTQQCLQAALATLGITVEG